MRPRHHVTTEMRQVLDRARMAGRKELTDAEEKRYSSLERELDAIDGNSTDSLVAATRCVPGNSRPPGRAGRPDEIVSRDVSMRDYFTAAQENGVRFTDESGRPLPKEPKDFDLNAYWGQRMGFTPPGAEMRALAQDVSDSGMAVTPQAWVADVIDFAYPLSIVGNLPVSQFAMTTEIVNVPQFTDPAQPQWVAEGSAISLDGNPSFGTVQHNATGAFIDTTLYSIQMAQDAYLSGGLPDFLAQSVGRNMAVLLDQAAFYGIAGSFGNPGMVNEVGFQQRPVTGGTGTVLSSTAEYSVAAESVRAANFTPSGIASSPQLYESSNRISGTSGFPMFYPMPKTVADLPWAASTTIGIEESGEAFTGGDQTSFYIGPWEQLTIGWRLTLETRVLSERYIDTGNYGLFSAARFSVRTHHPEGFVRTYGITVS